MIESITTIAEVLIAAVALGSLGGLAGWSLYKIIW